MKSNLFNTFAAASTLAGIVATAGAANAASISYTASSGDFTATNFTQTLSLQQFDSSLGTLNSVTLDIVGYINGNAKFESLDKSASLITANISATLNLTQGGTTLFSLNPNNSQSYSATAFDGNIDFAGTSGSQLNNIIDEEVATQTLTNDLTAFIGSGNVDFLLSAIADSKVTGSGNIISQIGTLAKGQLKVTYNYTSANSAKVPEPSALLGFGLIASFGFLSQSKKRLFQISK
ncbi:PEP-CTERM sorting domain-containing protein [Sphaerospermopsis aphanizomenoides BCCUSP55]|uniref:choice-of-anchor E domain-containing protein n=1 Tax=Sphaerospermopsis aphanizomenoides TaxID=459663 RepID=UPI001908687F|nr:PEP-CTERM sorting domain-containing protein [Sphaerospermopsis aphanizomenoides]MBK1989161.1 PEP-CTERM sorting domain-containing protein [Sphaerospermopsis aphanizomenoides BCCUSP55]